MDLHGAATAALISYEASKMLIAFTPKERSRELAKPFIQSLAEHLAYMNKEIVRGSKATRSELEKQLTDMFFSVNRWHDVMLGGIEMVLGEGIKLSIASPGRPAVRRVARSGDDNLWFFQLGHFDYTIERQPKPSGTNRESATDRDNTEIIEVVRTLYADLQPVQEDKKGVQYGTVR